MSVRLYSGIFLLMLITLQGCSSQVAMNDPRIPDPLVARMPISVAVRYPESFEHFVHEERVIGKETWTIDLGKSNKLLFTKLFGAMFANMQIIDANTDPASLGVDALIEPGIDAFEFSVPEQSQTDAFAVWIRYRIKIFDDAGTQIANWPISAYGKSQSSTFGGDDALQRAAVLAMRDAAALVILQMDKATGISQLGKKAAPATSPTALEPALTPAAQQTTATEVDPDEPG
ncbi:hypothetical protein [Woeseia oceani]|uniref:ABC-type transport auxiliary lipoprotein component domain-containing protein n=1 Tax=Woeseia oceani TaxID=1548547 RepID=A0A193LGA7_9GAMM|nr:hypothetical protein [Woeseia oceani]ANO51547.1 hypothetical protein BA177_10310 [Woeseia oceani]